jgi:cytosine/adenosine deaminase-related metal-dependent hydrolase
MAPNSENKRDSSTSEAEWYATPEGRRQTQRAFERAVRDGKLTRSAGARIPRTDPKLLAALAEQARAKATKAISIRVPVADLERARQIASKEGTGYQTVLKRAIHAGLRKVS